MSTPQTILDDVRKRMDGAIVNLKNSLSGLRAGRVSPTLLEPIKVEAYGSVMPLAQVATVNAPEAQLLLVQVWDKELAKIVEKAIRESDLGLNPIAEGQVIRIPIPPLSEERRKELCKNAAKYGEQTKVSVRNVRGDGMDGVKKMEKDKLISEDAMHGYRDDIQKLTDDHIKKVDEMVKAKTDDIMKV
ncbi:MAG: ribosome recycling factor [Proteobacteria bacterium]|nr:ribosome recycling factor [Pseudomonadota bacterium]